MSKLLTAFIVAMFAFSGLTYAHPGHEGETEEEHAAHPGKKHPPKHAKKHKKVKKAQKKAPPKEEEIPALGTPPEEVDAAPAPAEQ